MSHSKNKVDWCIRKAEKEMHSLGKHRGLLEIGVNLLNMQDHIKKSEHYLKATEYLNKGGYSDICASTIFYSIYHCLLAISLKFGYESRNQECTFALIHSLIEDKKIDFPIELLDKVASLDIEKAQEGTAIDIRENYQYGTSLSLKDDSYNQLLDLAKKVISKSKEILET